MTSDRRILGVHLSVAAAGAAVVFLALAVIAKALSLEVPPGASSESHWQLVRSVMTVGSLGTVALGSLGLAVCLAAAESLWRQWWRSRRFLAQVNPLTRHREVTVIADARPLAFCAGLARPRIYVSSATLRMLPAPELHAVLAHERHHVSRRDPLRMFVVRALSDALFFLPVLNRLAERYSTLSEIAADRAAVAASGGDPAALASALLAFDARASSSVVGIDPERVDHLCGEHVRWHLPLALLAWTGLVLTGVIVAALRAAEVKHDPSFAMPLLTEHLCLLAVVLAPLLAGAGALLAVRSVPLARVRDRTRRRV